MKCRLLYLVGQLRPGGLERQLYFLLNGMDRQRYRPEVVVWNFCEDAPYVNQIRALGVRLHFFPGLPTRVAKLRAIRRLVMQIRPEILHSYSFYTNFVAWWATLRTKTLAIGAVQSDFDRAKQGTGAGLGRLSARWPRSQIFNSFAAAHTAQRSRSPFAPRQCFVVRNGLDLKRFFSVPLASGGVPCIIGVGSLIHVKRWDRLLTAASALKQRGLDFRVRIIGDGPLRQGLHQQVQLLGLDEHVEFITYSDDIPGLMANAAFLVHPSDSEGCPNVVMEAMACGRAVVATDVGDVADLIDDGSTGFVVRGEDDAMLVSRMTTLITDRELCHRLGEAGRAKAEQGFGVERLVAETLAAYQAIGWKGA